MRPLEQYATLRRGRKIVLEQEDEEWRHRATMLRAWSHKFAHWFGLYLVIWGNRLQQVGVTGNAPFYKR